MNSIIELPAVKDNLNTVLDFIDSHLAEHGSSMKAQMQIETAVEELFVNIAGYAYSPYTGTVKIEFKCKDGIAWITFNDTGVPYNPLARTDPDVTLPAAARPIGGLGILMVKKMMDDVIYRYENGCNILTIKKKIV